MILTVTSNVALDRTYGVDEVELGGVNKVRSAFAQTGGKGVNVSRVAALLGASTLVSGLIGWAGLEEAAQELRLAGLESDLYPVSGPARQTVVVTAADGVSTAFDEPGPTVTELEWKNFEIHIARLLERASLIVLSGSLPPGAPELALRNLAAAAAERGLPVIVDARGAAMRAALSAKPLLAKLNRSELSETLGRPCLTDEEVARGALELRDAGAGHVIVTLGSHGALGVHGDELLRVTHPAAPGNPIGAGDAFTAAWAVAFLAGKPFEQALRDGATAALASLRSPIAGALDPNDLAGLAPTIEIHPMQSAGAQS
jgi:tagatose 6-phosphate kinase